MKQIQEQTSSKGFRIFACILAFLLAASAGVLGYVIWKMGVLPSHLELAVLGVLGCSVLLLVLLECAFTKRRWSKILFSLLCCGGLVINLLGAYSLFKAHSVIQSVTQEQPVSKTTVVVLVMKNDDTLSTAADLNGRHVGTLKTLQENSTKQCIESLQQQSIEIQQENFSSLAGLATALYEGEVPAIIMTYASALNLEEAAASAQENLDPSLQEDPASGLEEQEEQEVEPDLSRFTNFLDETRILYSMSYTVQKTETKPAESQETETEAKETVVEDITNTPFTVLISGIDSRTGLSEVSRSDSNILMGVNPNTHDILLISIPRDFYVSTACDPEDGCMQGAMDKLTHTGLHGTNATRRTLEQLFGIDINYTIRVNFGTVVSLVDALGGIDVTITSENAAVTSSGMVFAEGVNHLNGQQALAFARERYAYASGDRQRGKNQQTVISAIINKLASPAVLSSYASLMDVLAGSFSTTISQENVQTLIQMQLSDNQSWNIQMISVNGSGGTDFCAELGQNAYVMYPDMATVSSAVDQLKAMLEAKPAEESK